MVLLKKFLITLAVTLYSVVPVFAGDSDRVRGHWRGQGAKMLNLKAHQQPAWGHLKKAHLGGMRASARDLQLTKKQLRIAFQSRVGKEGLISHYKREYQIAVGRSLTRHHRLLMGVPSHLFCSNQSKGSGKSWGQGHGKSSKKRDGMGGDKCAGKRGDKGDGKGWGKSYSKNSNKRHGMGQSKNSRLLWNKGAGKRGDRSRGDKSQKNRKKKSFDSD